jgi:hypothetical protein
MGLAHLATIPSAVRTAVNRGLLSCPQKRMVSVSEDLVQGIMRREDKFAPGAKQEEARIDVALD